MLVRLPAGVMAVCCWCLMSMPATLPAQEPEHATREPAVGWSASLARRFDGIALSPVTRGEVVRTHASYLREIERIRDSARAAGERDGPELDLRLAALRREEEAAFRAILPPEARARFDENLAEVEDAARTTSAAERRATARGVRRTRAGGPPPSR